MTKTVYETVKAAWSNLTETEKKVAHAILSDYPLSGLANISELAEKAHVSPATITRFVTGLGYSNFIAFREAMRLEVQAKFVTPIDKKKALPPKDKASRPSFVTLFEEAKDHIAESVARIEAGDFAEVVDLLSDRTRSIFLVGGRMTRSVSVQMAGSLHALRPKVHLMDAGSLDAAELIADMRPKDVMVVLDVRRYQRGAIALAQTAAKKGCRVVLITDEWISPISRHANTIFALKVGTNSIWDSLVVPLLFTEAIVNAVGLQIWPQAQARLEELEGYWSSWMTFDTDADKPD